jgi:hypothetical protein
LPAYAYISRASLFDFKILQQNFGCQRLSFSYSLMAGQLGRSPL